MTPRFYVPLPLHAHAVITLPAGTARHVQVLRLQPGEALTLFDGKGGEWHAEVTHMGRSEVQVRVIEHRNVHRELALRVTLACGMPANERMDSLVEKATELGVAGIQPLVCERSVLRLRGERADKRVHHWRAVAAAASEQCGRTHVPHVADVMSIQDWLASLSSVPAADTGDMRMVLSLRPVVSITSGDNSLLNKRTLLCLSGPEGGLTPAEEDAAGLCGFVPVSLGPRVLRADTAPLAVMSFLSITHRASDQVKAEQATLNRAVP